MPELLLRVCPVCRSSYAGPPQSCPYRLVHAAVIADLRARWLAVKAPPPPP